MNNFFSHNAKLKQFSSENMHTLKANAKWARTNQSSPTHNAHCSPTYDQYTKIHSKLFIRYKIQVAHICRQEQIFISYPSSSWSYVFYRFCDLLFTTLTFLDIPSWHLKDSGQHSLTQKIFQQTHGVLTLVTSLALRMPPISASGKKMAWHPKDSNSFQKLVTQKNSKVNWRLRFVPLFFFVFFSHISFICF